ncbi:hypothetical protein PG994_005843 [Apiospora phragmitis]|uniref:N-acetyltransferase domain-containing protein n=1 Tax=Apiospora phragmitis TaxID=2905665 RepID=A0ABR1VDD2_9PEZI
METATRATELPGELRYIQYEHALEEQYLPAIRALISKDLSEPYSIYVYRYFLYQWAHLCYMASSSANSNTMPPHSPATHRGYIAMLAVSSAYRGHGIATALVKMAIDAMADRNADEVVLETEETNTAAMRLYERLGFLRSKKLHRYYLNGNSAYRLVLLLKASVKPPPPLLPLDSASAAVVAAGGGGTAEDARPVSPTH